MYESTFKVVTDMTDEVMVRLMQQNDERGLEYTMSAYSRLAHSIAAGILGDEQDRREAVSDACYKIWRTRMEIDLSRASLKGYVSMVTRSCALNKLKSVKSFEPLPDDERDLGIEVDVTDELNARHNERVIAECIRSMPSPDREIFISRYYYSKPIPEIAREQGMKPGRVEKLLSKNRRRLRAALLEGGILL